MNKHHTVSALAFVAMLSSASASVIIYQHDFNGLSADTLNGVELDTTNGALGGTANATWTAHEFFRADGSDSRTITDTLHHSAYVSFTPVSGYLYTISLTVDATLSGSVNRWVALSLTSGNPEVGSSFASGAGNDYASVARRSDGMVLRRVGTNATANGGVDIAGSASGAVSILLDTSDPDQWTFQWVADGIADSSIYNFGATGSVNYIRISSDGGAFVNDIISGFSVTADPIPEPTSAGLALLSLTLLTCRKRRK